ncbi:MAG: hypothetical protein ACXAE3_02310 [Candidatus Kariarchaeaceae archaeon]|jgi:HSP20 family molecular chaperone IbpA
MSKFEDLPEGVRKAIKELLGALSLMTPEQIFELLTDMLGEDVFTNIFDTMTLSVEFSEEEDFPLGNLDSILEEFEYLLYAEQDIEPYYEISHSSIDGGEIIVEMPLASEKNIEWYIFDGEVFIHATNGSQHFKLIIPLPDFYHIEEKKTLYRNGLFILPFTIE